MRTLLTFLFAAIAVVSTAQAPEVGLFIEEMEIPEPERSNIEASFGYAPSTIRVYLEIPENWELQYIYGVDDLSWSFSSPYGAYQHPEGGPTSLNINSALIPANPELAYDSWFTIGATDLLGNILYVLPGETVFSGFEAGDSTFAIDGPIGGGIYVTTFGQFPQNYPDANGRVLIAQLTVTESASMCFNVQVRRLNPDGTIYDPDGAGPLLSETHQITALCADYSALSCQADLNISGNVDVSDLLIMIQEFGCSENCAHDISGDGFVAVADLLILLGEFGESCSY